MAAARDSSLRERRNSGMVPLMSFEPLLGRRTALRIRRLSPAGAFLATDDSDDAQGPVILLPSSEIPVGVAVGDAVSVFVHLDSEERPIATTRIPKLALGEVAFLTVTACTDIGAFVDWGLGKELLVPFAQQSKGLFVGERQPIGLYIDNSGRLAGTMFVHKLLEAKARKLALDEWVLGEAWRNDPDIGLFVIVERSYVALVPCSEPHRLTRGDPARCRVAELLPDGKVVLSLRQHAYQEVEADAARILEVLSANPAPKLSDRSSPESLRDLFGISKKAFKRAVGRLLKDRKVSIDDDGIVMVVRDL
jgi:uncharacterized protein